MQKLISEVLFRKKKESNFPNIIFLEASSAVAVKLRSSIAN